jgi:hypothetical protein
MIKPNVGLAGLMELNRMKQIPSNIEIDLNSFREAKILGGGAFGVVKLMRIIQKVSCLE